MRWQHLGSFIGKGKNKSSPEHKALVARLRRASSSFIGKGKNKSSPEHKASRPIHPDSALPPQ
jgi:hypothetical protein